MSIKATKTKQICFHCVDDTYLKEEIKKHGKKKKCSYCEKQAQTYSLAEMASRIETAFEEHYYRTSDQPEGWESSLMSDKESDYEWGRKGDPTAVAIMNAAEIPENAASDIQEFLETKHYSRDDDIYGDETEFSSEAHYKERGPSDAHFREEWEKFERSLKTKARFFNSEGSAHLASVFEGIDLIKSREGHSLVIEAGPGTPHTAFYRARVFQSDTKLEEAISQPDKHIGPPPSEHATSGRMNAYGISVFYGASAPGTALAEVRPPVGSQVVVARFEITRTIRLLNLPALSDVVLYGSPFDPTFARRRGRATFLKTLSARMTKAVMPDDERFEYLPTQAIADFLAADNNLSLDGIVFPSVQAGNKALNIILFHKAARVEKIDLPSETKLSASLGYSDEDGWQNDYSVYEESPAEGPKPEQAPKPNTPWADLFIDHSDDKDLRPSTLRIDLDNIEVHIVEQVEFLTSPFKVRRHRFKRREEVTASPTPEEKPDF
ncbi:RES domain-containing protein [Corallococcus sp. AB049A]|uniref:RES domain-containing protein n=1 Tax=Corallococcus sp. AB049A TaxID=2316721 RepID=UPI000EE57397|nr:RES domain-containing protein [Corallococcus sp. AB049A]RKI71692.1 RES domain-containing protein [Corallococcus sp. AB049A]